MLKARLYEFELQRREEAANDAPPAKPKLAGAIKFGLMCYIPTKW